MELRGSGLLKPINRSNILTRSLIQGTVNRLMGGDFDEGAIAGLVSGIADAVGDQLKLEIQQALDNQTLTGAQAFVARQFARTLSSAIRIANTDGHPSQAFAQEFLRDLTTDVLHDASQPRLGKETQVPLGPIVGDGEDSIPEPQPSPVPAPVEAPPPRPTNRSRPIAVDGETGDTPEPEPQPDPTQPPPAPAPSPPPIEPDVGEQTPDVPETRSPLTQNRPQPNPTLTTQDPELAELYSLFGNAETIAQINGQSPQLSAEDLIGSSGAATGNPIGDYAHFLGESFTDFGPGELDW